MKAEANWLKENSEGRHRFKSERWLSLDIEWLETVSNGIPPHNTTATVSAAHCSH